MFEIFDGDLLNTDCLVIAHQVNCKGQMDNGVARQLNKKYRGLFDEYKSFADKYHELLLGQNIIVKFYKPERRFFNSSNGIVELKTNKK